MLQGLGLSERRACLVAGTAHSTQRYRSIKPPDRALRQRMHVLADRHRRFGHPRLHVLLRREGFGANHKKTHRPRARLNKAPYLPCGSPSKPLASNSLMRTAAGLA